MLKDVGMTVPKMVLYEDKGNDTVADLGGIQGCKGTSFCWSIT